MFELALSLIGIQLMSKGFDVDELPGSLALRTPCFPSLMRSYTAEQICCAANVQDVIFRATQDINAVEILQIYLLN